MSSSTPAEVLALELCPVADLTGGTPLRNGTPRLLEG